MANTCEATAVVILILDIIGSIVMGVMAESFWIFLAGIVGGFIFFLILYGLGTVIKNQEDTLGAVRFNQTKLEKLHKEFEKNSTK